MNTKRLVGWNSMILGVGMLSGCALTVDKVALDYTPQTSVARVAQAESVTVKVRVNDVRRDTSRVSSKKNAYGMEMAPIVADNDVSEHVKNAISTELRSRGFGVGDGPTIVHVELQKFYSDFKVGFFAGDAVAEVTMNVQVQGPNETIVFSKIVSGDGKEPDIQLASGANAKAALDRALKDAIESLFRDRAFIDALLKAGKG